MNRIPLYIIIVLLFYSCSTTKSLQNGEVLYTGSTIKINKQAGEDSEWKVEKASDKYSDLYLSLWDTPNGAFMGLPFVMFVPTRLWIYNLFYTDGNSGFAQWMRKNFGERPVTISNVSPELKTLKAVNVLENYGHFGTTGEYELKYNKKKNKARVVYKLEITPSYHYRNILFENDPTKNNLNKDFLNYQSNSLLHTGNEFNLGILKKEKNKIWEYLQNNGYFYIKEDDILMRADTTVGARQIDLTTRLNNSLNDFSTFPQRISHFDIQINNVLENDTTGRFYNWDTGRIRKRFMDRLLPLKEGDLYSLKATKLTRQNISDLGIFSNTNLSYQVVPGDTSLLRAELRMEPLDATTIAFNVKGNYENVGYIGPSVGMDFKQLNVFNGAENLTISADAYYNFPLGAYRERLSNSSGFSLRSTLTFPFFNENLGFIKKNYMLPQQIVSFNTDFNDRKDYFDLFSWSTGYGWIWKSSAKITHKLQLLDITYSDIYNTTSLFDSLVTENPSQRESLVKQFILGSGYTFTYDGRNRIPRTWNMYFEGGVELAGNSLYLLHSIFGNEPVGEQKFLGLNYSQFSRLKYDFRLYYNFTENSQLAFRHIGGFGFAYGNSDKMPYIRDFFIGGSNSLRPVSARTLGPGRYFEFNQNEVTQVGNMKLEVDLEYRFKLFWKLHGAVWSDAGNIWLLKDDPSRPGGKVRWNHLFEDSYLTAGVGARLNLDYVLVRFDYGAVLYLPIFQEGYRWLWQNKGGFWYPVISFGLPF